MGDCLSVSFKYLVLGDLHLDVRAPSRRRIDDYEAACFSKLNQVKDYASTNNIQYILVTGDWFHKKTPSAVPHSLVVKVIEWLNSCDDYGIKVLTVAGNHDVQHLDFSHEARLKQPIGVVATSCPNFIDLDWPEQYLQYFRHTKNSEVYLITGSRYQAPVSLLGQPAEIQSQFGSEIPADVYYDVRIHLCHASCVDKVPNWRPYTLVKDAIAVSYADIIHCGHIHDNVGCFSGRNALGKPCLFTNLGSMTRGALTEETIVRLPGFVEITVGLNNSKAVEFKIVSFDCRSADQIYDIRGYSQEKEVITRSRQWAKQLRQEFGKTEIEAEESFADLIKKSSVLDYESRELALRILEDAGG